MTKAAQERGSKFVRLVRAPRPGPTGSTGDGKVSREVNRHPVMNQNRRSASAFFRPMELTYDTWVASMFVLLVMVIAATFLFGLRQDE
jgi:hypothetical protein